MNQTPNASRAHVAIFGNTNAGKSALVNAFLGQNVSIVSEIGGTTTDPVYKPMELLPFGPIVLIDTAGLNDMSVLGIARIERTRRVLAQTDFALYVLDATAPDTNAFEQAAAEFVRLDIPYLCVINKFDVLTSQAMDTLKNSFPDAIMVSAQTGENIDLLKQKLSDELAKGQQEMPLIGDLLPYGSKVVLVVPVDSEAPKGRIILPQNQLIRDCLDHGIKCYVCRDTELESALSDLTDIALVVTDSQAFGFVSKTVPETIPLTSFSILFARQKGDLATFVQGTDAIPLLADGSRILMAESCSHNHTHEDIGRHKIPNMLRKITGKDLIFDFDMGLDFPDNLKEYDLVVHCGSCMLGRRVLQHRVRTCKEAGVPITNYGVILSYMNGILPRATTIFKLKTRS